MNDKIELEPLPNDGAKFRCSVELPSKTWPYTKRCDDDAVGLLPKVVEQWATVYMTLAGRAICEKHGKMIIKGYTEDLVDDED